ncbi:type III secretion system chaperone [Acanthopleuribacter pedis]|uniref:Type III secretion system chaperone n=1 Tax=Acanthopleuribacter pedis TaxID=442870 RepID=A0A8J7Q5D6_9BACT|nr:type III secretion system chaperone [Acanthopleuribacter pedis]MBO1319395.1 type III secretion system chaperone [Acanthopleuribacter pedis]
MTTLHAPCSAELEALRARFNLEQPDCIGEPDRLTLPLQDHGLVYFKYQPDENVVCLSTRFFEVSASTALYEALLTANLFTEPVDSRLGIEPAGHCILFEGTYQPGAGNPTLTDYTQSFVNQIRRWQGFLADHHDDLAAETETGHRDVPDGLDEPESLLTGADLPPIGLFA